MILYGEGNEVDLHLSPDALGTFFVLFRIYFFYNHVLEEEEEVFSVISTKNFYRKKSFTGIFFPRRTRKSQVKKKKSF